MFKFAEGATVAVKSDNHQLGLVAGDSGGAWGRDEGERPADEVTFRPQHGEEFDALMFEQELTEPAVISRQENSLAAA